MRWGERLKRMWARLPKLPRRWRIVRNLAAAAAAGALAVFCLDWPAFSACESFRRAEAKYLLTPSRIVLQMEYSRYTVFLSEGDSWITVGSVTQVDDTGKLLNLDRNQVILHQVLPKERVVVVMLPVKNEDNGAVVAVWGGPEEGVSGVLELDLEGIENPVSDVDTILGLETFAVQTQRREDGWFIFQFRPHDNHREGQSCAMEMLLWLGPWFHGRQVEQPYRLTLTDAQGRTVAEQSGTLPPDQRLYAW